MNNRQKDSEAVSSGFQLQAGENLLRVSTNDSDLVVDLDVGHIRELVFNRDGKTLLPLHTAPWVHEDPDDLPDTLPPCERYLSGDFLCAPFGTSDIEEAPLHGWSANSKWVVEEVVEEEGKLAFAKLKLEKKILGATVEKEMLLMEKSPLLYQTHRFIGGEGGLPVAHHVMTRMEAGGILCHSPIDHLWTHDTPQDPKLNLLAYPAKSKDMAQFPRAEGGIANLSEYPLAGGYEDFLVLVEGLENQVGWTAVQRNKENDIVFVVKEAKKMPVTMLWHSNGGRRDKPWSSRHTGVLGIEDGMSYGIGGHKISAAENPLNTKGVPTCMGLDPDGQVETHHVIGAVPRPEKWTKTTSIDVVDDALVLTDRRDDLVVLNMLPGYFPHLGR